MDFEILQKKTVVDGKIDMLSTFLQIDYDKIEIQEWILIDSYTVMGLDAIAHKIYGDESYLWILYKFNRIDNILAVNVDDVIAVPNINSFRQNIKWVTYEKMLTAARRSQSASFDRMRAKATPSSKVTPMSNFTKKSGNVIF